MAKVRILFVMQCGGVLDEHVLTKMFGRYGVVERVKNLKNYAFVHFERREDAQSAMDALDCFRDAASGVFLDVAWAKPPADKKTQQRMLRNRERRVRKSAVAAISQPVRYAPRPLERTLGAKRRVGSILAAAAYTEYDHRGYDFGLRQPCNWCTPASTLSIPVAEATSDKRNNDSTRRCGANECKMVRHDDGRRVERKRRTRNC
jgi:RNA recognition motif-containing protein